MIISEPMTMLTDYAIALEAWLFAVLLGQYRQQSVRLWAVGFAAVGVAAIAGGTYHGLALALPAATTALLWQCTLYAIGLSGAFAWLGTVVSSISKRSQPIWFVVIGLKLLLYFYLTTTQRHFLYAIADYFSAILIVLMLHIKVARHHRNPSLVWAIAAVVLSGIAASFLWGQVSLAFLNPDTAYHLIQMGALYLFFRSARLLKDR